MNRLRSYLLSLPERLLRSGVGLGAGVLREIGQIAIPGGVRRGHLYQNLVDTTLRFLIERVGGADGVYASDARLADDFLIRRTAGNALEVLGIVAFRASPVWILAAMADLCGAGRTLIPEIADALKNEGLLEENVQFTSAEQVLDGLERTSARLASTVNTPPLDVAALRDDWRAIREEAGTIAPGRLPSREAIADLWSRLKEESTRQGRSVFELSSMLALSAAGTAASRTGQVLGSALLDHYRQTLRGIRDVGYGAFAKRQLTPYVRAALNQFSPATRTMTQRALDRGDRGR